MPDKVRAALAGYGGAVLFTALAVALRWLLDPWLGDHMPVATLFAAVALAVWFGGYRPALLAAVLGYLAADWLFISRRQALDLHGPRELIGAGLYLASCAVLVAFGEAARVNGRLFGEMRRRVEEYETLLAILPVGIWRADPACERIVGNRAAYDMLGLPAGVNASLTSTRDALGGVRCRADGRELAPEDLPLYRAARTALVVRNFEHDVVFDDGRVVTVYVNAAPLLDRDGAVRGVLGVTVDLTERHRVEELARAEAARVQFVADAVPALIAYIDAGACYRLNNRAYEAWFGHPRGEVVGRHMRDVLGDAAWAAIRPHVEAALAGRRVLYEAEVPYRDGGTRWISATYTPDVGPDGAVRGFVAHVNDVTERKRAEAALGEAARRKDEFLATLAHELRNPLAPIRNAVRVLKGKGQPDPELAWCRDVIDRQVAHMARLLEDLLDVSRVSREKLELRRERIDLAGVIAAAVETSRPLVEEGRHDLAVDLPAEPVWLDADPVRLAQVFANLLNNAAKYTPPGGRIALAATARDGEVAVAVRDTGIGIAADVLPRLFEIFAQARPALELAQGGLGIGLALVKGLVELHGGRVAASSAGPGTGSEFVVRLPVAAPPADRPAPDLEPDRPAGRKVVVADDNRDAADSLAMLLGLLGHDVRTARDGVEAVEVAEAFRPEVILLDIGMPRLDGYGACRRIRAQSWGGGVFLVALTGWGQEEDKRRAAEAGFDAHLVKPADPARLDALLRGAPARP